MKLSSIERALDMLQTMEKGWPYSLRPEDRKRRLVDDLARLARRLKIRPIIIGGLAVNHHGYVRATADVDILLTREDAARLRRRMRRRALDVHVSGHQSWRAWQERLPDVAAVRVLPVRPLPVPTLHELIALKAMTGLMRDASDIMELLKLHRRRIPALHKSARARLRTEEARRHLDAVIARTREEIAQRR